MLATNESCDLLDSQTHDAFAPNARGRTEPSPAAVVVPIADIKKGGQMSSPGKRPAPAPKKFGINDFRGHAVAFCLGSIVAGAVSAAIFMAELNQRADEMATMKAASQEAAQAAVAAVSDLSKKISESGAVTEWQRTLRATADKGSDDDVYRIIREKDGAFGLIKVPMPAMVSVSAAMPEAIKLSKNGVATVQAGEPAQAVKQSPAPMPAITITR